MYCPSCGTQNPEHASFCLQCGKPLESIQEDTLESRQITQSLTPPLKRDDLASLWLRVASSLIDWILQAIPTLGIFIVLINWIMFRRGNTIGMKLVSTRIVRKNGDISGFYHTFVRSIASILSTIPLGLGFWWAFWDPWKQTWHDKIMGTYVVRDTDELSTLKGTSARGAIAVFWIFLFIPILGFLAAVIIPNVGRLVD